MKFHFMVLLTATSALAYIPGYSQQRCFPMREPGTLELKTDYNTSFMLFRAVDVLNSSSIPHLRGYDFAFWRGADNPVMVCNETLASQGICDRGAIETFVVDGDFAIMNQFMTAGSDPIDIPVEERGMYCLHASTTAVVQVDSCEYDPTDLRKNMGLHVWYDFQHKDSGEVINGLNYERKFIWLCMIMLAVPSFVVFMWYHHKRDETEYPFCRLLLDYWLMLVIKIISIFLSDVFVPKFLGFQEDHFDWSLGLYQLFCNKLVLWPFLVIQGLEVGFTLEDSFVMRKHCQKYAFFKSCNSPDGGDCHMAFVRLLILFEALAVITTYTIAILAGNNFSPRVCEYCLEIGLSGMALFEYYLVASFLRRAAGRIKDQEVSRRITVSIYVSMAIHSGLHILSWVSRLMIQLCVNGSIYWTWHLVSSPVMEEAGMTMGLFYVLLKNLSKFSYLLTVMVMSLMWYDQKAHKVSVAAAADKHISALV